MANDPIIIDFKFRHCELWKYRADNYSKKHIKEMAETQMKTYGIDINQINTYKAKLISLPNTMGRHIIVSAFDGNEHYTIQTTGGNCIYESVITKQVANSEIQIMKVEDPIEAINAWFDMMPSGLAEAASEEWITLNNLDY